MIHGLRAWMVPAALAAVVLGGCAIGPDYKRPPVTPPDAFRGQVSAGEVASLADAPWWEAFRDPVLNGLIQEALAGNYDVRIAAARVQNARAQAVVARAPFFPQLGYGANAARSKGLGNILGLPGSSSDESSLYLGGISMSWEIDLWGKIRRLSEAASARLLASEEGRRAVLLSLLSDVAQGYFELLQLDARVTIARQSTEAYQGTYNLFKDRLQFGVASELQTSRAEGALAQAAASIPELESQIAAKENQISTLLGRNPGPIPRGTPLFDQAVTPTVPAGLPSALLERRPDLRRAEQELVAANANVGVAVANFYPTISLTGAFGGVAPELAGLFGAGRSWSLGGGLLSPVLQGRRLEAQHRVAVAQWEEAKVQYERSVNNAFSEVATALVAYQKLAGVESEQARAVTVNREAVRLSNQRYLAGRSDYLEVLQAEQQQFAAENAVAQTHFNRLASLVQLYKALGGGWQLSDQQWARREAAVAPSSR